MGGRGPAPAVTRRRRNAPARGEWTTADGSGWQHGAIPAPPPRLLAASRVAWETWMRSWFAAHWTPADLPALRLLIRLYDQVERGEFQRASELRLWSDTFGISPKGAAERRWLRPNPAEPPASPSRPAAGTYGRLRALDERGFHD